MKPAAFVGGDPLDDRAPVARIYYLTNPLTRSDIEILTTAREVGEIQKIAECNGPRDANVFTPPAIAVRGNSAVLAQASQIIEAR